MSETKVMSAYKSLPPNVRQLSEYTEGRCLPPVVSVEFRKRRAGRGRPRKGTENREFNDLEQVKAFLLRGAGLAYDYVVVRFVNEARAYVAQIERVLEKIMLVIEDIGIVCVANPEPLETQYYVPPKAC